MPDSKNSVCLTMQYLGRQYVSCMALKGPIPQSGGGNSLHVASHPARRVSIHRR